MKDIKLSPRLDAILGALGVVKTLADVGCDHGFISIAAVLRGKCESAIAMDINDGPLKSAMTNASLYGVKDAVSFRLSNGLEKVVPGEVDGIIIAGMGGLLIRDILERGEDVAKSARRLVLSPQSDIPQVRSHLLENGYIIADEDCLIDDEKFYFIIAAEQAYGESSEYPHGQLGVKFGGRLLQKKHPILLRYLKKQIEQVEEIAAKPALDGTDRKAELLAERDLMLEAVKLYH